LWRLGFPEVPDFPDFLEVLANLLLLSDLEILVIQHLLFHPGNLGFPGHLEFLEFLDFLARQLDPAIPGDLVILLDQLIRAPLEDPCFRLHPGVPEIQQVPEFLDFPEFLVLQQVLSLRLVLLVQ
jgi:hypothetical protein